MVLHKRNTMYWKVTPLPRSCDFCKHPAESRIVAVGLLLTTADHYICREHSIKWHQGTMFL